MGFNGVICHSRPVAMKATQACSPFARECRVNELEKLIDIGNKAHVLSTVTPAPTFAKSSHIASRLWQIVAGSAMFSLASADADGDMELGLMDGAAAGTDLMVIGRQTVACGLSEVMRANPVASCIVVATTAVMTIGAAAALMYQGTSHGPAQTQSLPLVSGGRPGGSVPSADSVCSDLVVKCHFMRGRTVDNFSTADVEEINYKSKLLIEVLEQHIANGTDAGFFVTVGKCVGEQLRVKQIEPLIAHIRDLQTQLPTSQTISDMIRPAIAKNLQYGLERIQSINQDLLDLMIRINDIILDDIG